MKGNPNPNQSNLRPFKKGPDERRNNKGRPPKLPDLDKLLDRVLGEENGDLTAMEEILKAIRAKAIKGDIRAGEVLLERAYGKPKQPIDHTSGGEKINVPIIKWVSNGDRTE